jgi:hypothetical protein
MPCEFRIDIGRDGNKAADPIPGIRNKASIIANCICAIIVALCDPDLIAINRIYCKRELIKIRESGICWISNWESLFNAL